MLESILSHYEAAVRASNLIGDSLRMQTLKCNLRNANQVVNFCTIMPDKYYTDDVVRAGALSVMASAGIGFAWKGRTECICSSLLQLALALVGQATIGKAAPLQERNTVA